jgi:lipopolysaccharide transport system permease protein
MSSPSSDWDLIIRPSAGWFDWRLGELWQHRDLLWMLVWRDFVTLHKQTILGPLWHIISPILTTLTYYLIFGRVVRLPTDGMPPFLFYMAGTVAWNYFAACLVKTSSTLSANAGLFGKVYFHRLVVPLSAVISSLISFGIQLSIFIIFMLVFWMQGVVIHPNAWLWTVPLLIMMLAGFGLAFGLICSALTTRYRDLGQLIGFATQLLMYATPVIYPLSMVSDRQRWIIQLNPLTPVIETFRYAFFGKGAPDALHLGSSLVVLAVLFIIALTLFTRTERTFMDTV